MELNQIQNSTKPQNKHKGNATHSMCNHMRVIAMGFSDMWLMILARFLNLL